MPGSQEDLGKLKRGDPKFDSLGLFMRLINTSWEINVDKEEDIIFSFGLFFIVKENIFSGIKFSTVIIN